jgi:hypothetical protein
VDYAGIWKKTLALDAAERARQFRQFTRSGRSQ